MSCQTFETTTTLKMQAHNLSSRVMSPDLQVFQVPKTDTSMLGVRFTQLRPVTTGINPMEFLIPATETLIDLNRSYFEMEVKLQTSTPANLAYNTVLYPVTNLAHTMIKQLSVHVNGVLLEPQTDHYHYKAFFETILNNNRNDGETILEPQGWYNDFDLPNLLTANAVDSTHADYKSLTDSQQLGVAAMKKPCTLLRGAGSIRCSLPPTHLCFVLASCWSPCKKCPSRCTSTTQPSSC